MSFQAQPLPGAAGGRRTTCPLPQHLEAQPALGVAVVVDRLDLGEAIAGKRQVQVETLHKVPPAAALPAAVAEPGPRSRHARS